jgi:Protein of unknown function (DUF1638).
MVELGLDKRPELRDDYFKNYSRVIWLAQVPSKELEELATQAAASIGLPLEIQKRWLWSTSPASKGTT